MRNSIKVIIGLTSLAAIGAIVFYTRKDKTIKKFQQQAADEGYETAFDILYPLKMQKARRV